MNPVIDATLRTVGALYIEACHELCSAYDLEIELDEGAPSDIRIGKGCFMSVLTLTGQAIRLSSVLTVEDPLLVWTHAARSPAGSPVDLEDWCREFSNQLGGRLKNKLLPEGMEVTVGLAALIPGAAAEAHDGPPTDVQRCFFTSPKGWLRAELSMYVAPGFTVAEVPGVVQGDALLEGMFLMF